jgi:DNA-binding SARP family transcriptional activator/predicted ATPase
MTRAAGVRIELLGRFQITRGGQAVAGVSTSRLQALVAYLALHREAAISRQQLAFLFWPDSEESQARTNLRQLLHHLRAALPEAERYLKADHQSLWWQPDGACEIDVVAFEEAATRGDLESAARLYSGDLLPALYDEWLDGERERLKRRFEDVLDALVTAAAGRGDQAGAIRFAEIRLVRDTLREASYQTLMRLYAAGGDRAGALRIYQQCADVLRRELDVAPGPATERAREQAMQAGVAASGRKSAIVRATIPLVGRGAEWKKLQDLWKGAAAGRPTLVVLTGEAGIGKTRLLEELIDRAVSDGALAAQASCYAGDRALAYTAAADWLRSAAMRDRVKELPAAQRSQLARVLPEILDQPGVGPPAPFTEAWQKRVFFEALARAVLNPAGPVLLAIDDLQWCDLETIEWLHYLMRADRGARLMIAATARTEETVADRMRVAELGVEIPLGPLNQADTLRLAAQVAGSAAPESVYERTRGNPLFVVETARAGWQAQEEIPAKVHAVITNRLGRLSEGAQQLAGVAAAIGRPFGVELITTVAGMAEDPVVAGIDELWRHGVLRQQTDGGYDYSHASLRDVAYGALGPARRRQLHRRIAESMESADAADADTVCGQIAGHYERAGIAERAIPFYRRAAQVVRRRFAEAEAIAYIAKALRLLETLPLSAERDQMELDLLLEQGLAYSATEGYASEDAGRVYARARVVCEVSRETGRYFGVLAGSWAYHIVRAELAISREIAERYLALAHQEGDQIQTAAGEFCLGASTIHAGGITRGFELVDAGMRHESEWGGPPARLALGGQEARPTRFLDFGPELGVFGGSYMSHLLWLTGEPDAALDRSNRVVARAEALDHPFSLALALAYAAMLHHFRDEPDPTRQRAEEAAALCRRYGFRYYLAWTPILSGWAQARLGDRATGLDAMLQGFADLQATGAGIRAPYYLALIAEARAQSGDPAAGLRHLEQAVSLGESSGEKWIQSEVQRIKGELLLQTGERAPAEVCFRNAVRLARSMGAKPWEAAAGRSLGKVLHQRA